MPQTMPYDVAIIGAGSAGLSLAFVCARIGLKTILFEGHKMGGDCLNYGCVPSKSLLAVARKCWQARQLNAFGADFSLDTIDMKKVMASVQEKIDTIAPNDSVTRFQSLGVEVVQASATFLDSRRVAADNQTYTARKIVIASGSSPFIPPIEGLDEVNYLTNETIFSLQEKPKHLIIIGGGPIGCEMAQAFALLGVKVSLIEGLKLLGAEDRDVVADLKGILQRQGVDFFEPAILTQVAQNKKGVQVTYQIDQVQHSLTGSHLLIAVGRRANIDSLHLDKAGVKTENGHIQVDKRLRTSQSHIYAIGDVIGQQQFTHAANAHAGVVFKQIAFRMPATWDDSFLPRVTYTHPELAHVGLTEKSCREQGIPYSVHVVRHCDNDRMVAEGETEGRIKLLINRKKQVIGITLLASHGGELLLPWIQLMREKRSLRSMTDVIIPYPTFSEISKRVVSQYYAPKLFSPWVKKIVAWLR